MARPSLAASLASQHDGSDSDGFEFAEDDEGTAGDALAAAAATEPPPATTGGWPTWISGSAAWLSPAFGRFSFGGTPRAAPVAPAEPEAAVPPPDDDELGDPALPVPHDEPRAEPAAQAAFRRRQSWQTS